MSARNLIRSKSMKTAKNLKSIVLSAIFTVATFTANHAAAAGYREEEVERLGPFIIHRIFEKGVFHRCAATLQPGKNMLRVAWTLDHVYSISVPGTKKGKKLTMDFNDMESFSFPAATNGVRTWAAWDNAAVETLRGTQESINISVNGKDFSWNIGNTSMRRVMAAVEDCVQHSQ
jgi:hypothetical protein